VNRLIRFARLPLPEKALLIEAASSLTLATVALKTVPFARIARRLGRHMAESRTAEEAAVTERAARVQWAIETAARHLPWKPVCFPQAVAGTLMLRRRGIQSTLYFGVDPGHDLDAHAWVRVGNLVVTGGPLDGRFTVVSTFA